MRVRLELGVIVALACASGAGDAHAESSPELYAFVALDAWPAPEFGSHGIAALELRLPDIIKGSRLTLAYNTDTLTARIDRACFADGWCMGGQLRGELFLAQVMRDYFVRGLNDERFGIRASYVEATAFIDGDLGGGLFVNYSAGVRQWFFGANADEEIAAFQRSDAYVIPPGFLAFEQRFHFTYWKLASDPSLYEPHRLFPRIEGFAFGLTLGLDVRDQRIRWGAVVDPDDPLVAARNDPKQNIYQLRQWMRMGKVLFDGVRVQLSEFAGWQRGGDDLSRTRIGGLNPYVIPIAGTPWGAFVSSRFITWELSLPIRIFGEVEVGPVVQAGFIEDTLRTGLDDFEGVVGMGLVIDARFGDWQLDVRGGYAPPLEWSAETPNISVFANLGWRIL